MRRSNPLRRAWKAVEHNAVYGLAMTLRAAFGRLPAGARLSTGAALGGLVWRLVGSQRRQALSNLALSLGTDRPEDELRRIGRESFRNLGRSAAEICGLWRSGSEEVRALFEPSEGLDRLKAILAGGRGAVVVTAHLDNWELCGAYVAAGVPVTAVARRLYFEKYERAVSAMRRRFGMDIVYQDESPRKLLRALRDGRVVALLADQDIPRLDGVFVEFFGRPAYTPSAPAELAAASGAPLVLGYSLRVGGNRHRLEIEGPVEFDRSDRRRAALEGTRGWCRLLEEVIREHPEQWVWMHRRWRTRPEDRPEAARRSGLEVPDVAAAQPAGAGEAPA